MNGPWWLVGALIDQPLAQRLSHATTQRVERTKPNCPMNFARAWAPFQAQCCVHLGHAVHVKSFHRLRPSWSVE
ncbi:MAG: hypothetical protein DWI12_06465 [Planctomycetota bacterium]|nr:MAG: hypothetical protein DWI12_06465 [Planctomycetota bacterium]